MVESKTIYPTAVRTGVEDKGRKSWDTVKPLYKGGTATVTPTKNYIHPARLYLKIPLTSIPAGVLIKKITFYSQHKKEKSYSARASEYNHYFLGCRALLSNWKKQIIYLKSDEKGGESSKYMTTLQKTIKSNSYVTHNHKYTVNWLLTKEAKNNYCLIAYHNIYNRYEYIKEEISLHKVYAKVSYIVPKPVLNITLADKKDKKVEEGKDFKLKLNVTDTNKTGVRFQSKVTLPSEITYKGCENCTVTQQNNILTVTYTGKNAELLFKANTVGQTSQIQINFLTSPVDNATFKQDINFLLDIVKTTLKCVVKDRTDDDEYVSVNSPKIYDLVFTGPFDVSSKMKIGINENSHIQELEIKDPDGNEVELTKEEEIIALPDDITLTIYSFTAHPGNYTAQVNFKTAGETDPYILFQSEDGMTNNFSYMFIQSSEYFTEFCTATTELTAAEKARMIDGDFYFLQVYAKVTSEEYDEGTIIPDYRENHRICLKEVYEEYDEDTEETETITNYIWSYNRVDGYNLPEYILLTVYFRFNKTANYTIILKGEPIGDGAYPESTYFIHTNPCIQHEDHESNIKDFPEPLPLLEQERIDTINFDQLNENLKKGLPITHPGGIEYIFYDYEDTQEKEEDEDEDEQEIPAISGIKIEGSQEVTSDESEEDKNHDETGALQVTIRTDQKSSTRTILPDEEGTYTSGSRTDDFNLNQDTIQPKDLHVHVKNTTLYDNIINDFSIQIYSFTPVQSEYSVYVEYDDAFVDLAKYGVFLQDVTIEGMNTNTKYITVDGSDETIPILQTLKPKSLEIKFNILGETLEESSELLEHVQSMLLNDKDDLNRPVEKSIMFDHFPERIWEYVMEEGINAQVKYNYYECSAKLNIPSGCSYSSEILTGSTGAIRSSFPVSPNLLLKITKGNKDLIISESNSNQEMRIFNDSSAPFAVNQYIQIDCENRTVFVETDDDDIITDISDQVDFSSDWFVLDDDYLFEYENCILEKVAYYLKKII